MLALIVAYSDNRVIGDKGKIPWTLENEKKRFKELTTGNVVIMGRKTYEEIGRPLPNRYTIVVSKTTSFESDNCTTAMSLDDAINIAKEKFKETKDIFIAGGEQLYKEAIECVDKMYITKLHARIDGDTYFPEFDESEFEQYIDEYVEEIIPYTYMTYVRK